MLSVGEHRIIERALSLLERIAVALEKLSEEDKQNG